MSTKFKLFVYGCFFFSGAAGLVYEVVWARQLGLFLGITGYAHTVVITAYMAGLAAGSWFFGRRSDHAQEPLKIYAWLEIGVGLYAATTPWLFTALQSAYAGMAGATGVVGTSGHLARMSIALAALLVPTFLMGGTLPLLVRGVLNGLPELGRVASRLYGINTLGAMAGTLLAGFVFIERLGISLTIYVGVVINLGIAVLVLLAMRKPGWGKPIDAKVDYAPNNLQSDDGESDAVSNGFSPGLRLVILTGFGAAGFAALLTQMAWIRALILMVGGSVYAFTIALASFLAGIGIGSLLYTRFFSDSIVESPTERLPQAGFVAVVIGFTILCGIPLLAMLPKWFLLGYGAGLANNFGLFQLYIFSLAFVLMFLPTLFMGILFPLVAVIWTQQFTAAGRGVGTAYAINTTGTILGALLGGLLILPWLGIQHSLVLSAAIYTGIAVVFWAFGTTRLATSMRSIFPLASVVLFAVIAWYIPPWDSAVWGNGVYYRPEYAAQEIKTKTLHEVMSEVEMLYYEEGVDGTVVVSQDDEQRFLIINGKTDASSKGDLPTQILLGHLPALIHPNPRSGLIIGLGSGVTAAAVANHDSIEQITVLEILPEVVEASEFFVSENKNILADPRVNLITADARNYVLSTDQTWDLIISEPSNPWVSGISNLFTDDFFNMIKQRLSAGGIMVQWFHAYSMSVDDMKTVLHTFSQSFSNVSVWNVQSGDLVLIGSENPYVLDVERLDWAMADEKIGSDLGRAEIHRLRDLMRLYLIGGELLDSYTAGATLNTDDRPQIEFSAPRNLYAETTTTNLLSVARHLKSRPNIIPVVNLARANAEGLDVTSMNLTIEFPDRSEITSAEAQWLVWREMLKQDGKEQFGLGSSRQLQWQENATTRRVQAIWLETESDADGMDYALQNSFRFPSVRSGNISISDGRNGRWRQAQENGQFEVAIMWHCPDPAGGFTRYFAYSLMPDPGEPQWGSELVKLAAHFSCYERTSG